MKLKSIKLKLKLKYNNQKPLPFRAYAEFECSLKRVNINKGGYTKLYQKHVPSSIGAKLVCIDNKFTLPTKVFTGSNSIKEFIEWIFEQQKYWNKIINRKFNRKFKMSLEDEDNYKNSQDCCICNQKIKEKDQVRYNCYLPNE